MKAFLSIAFLMTAFTAAADNMTIDQAKKLSGKYELVSEKIEGFPSLGCNELTVDATDGTVVKVSFDGISQDSIRKKYSHVMDIHTKKNKKTTSRDYSEAGVRGDRVVEREKSSIRVIDPNLVQLNFYTSTQATDYKLLLFGRSPRYMNDQEWFTYEANLSEGTILYQADETEDSDRMRQIECLFKKVQ